MDKLNLTLEIINGAWSLLTFFFLIFLSVYLWTEAHRRGLTISKWFYSLPLGMTVALALYLNNAGSFVTRSTIWAWRHFSGGNIPMNETQIWFLILGALMAAGGMLAMIKVFSRSFGDWPWVVAAIITVFYVLTGIIYGLV